MNALETDIHNLLYISEISDFANQPNELLSIGRKSRYNNLKKEITGILIKIDNVFIQLLEGNERAVTELFDKISKDSRHKNLSILVSNAVHERCCQKWEMAILNLDNKKTLEQIGYTNGIDVLKKIKANNSVLFLIKSLIKNKIEVG